LASFGKHCNWNIYRNSFLANTGPKLKSSGMFLLRPPIPNLSRYIKCATVQQSVHTQHRIKPKELHVSVVQNDHPQASRFGNITCKSYSRRYVLNVWLRLCDFLIIFMNREDRWLLFYTAVKCRGFRLNSVAYGRTVSLLHFVNLMFIGPCIIVIAEE